MTDSLWYLPVTSDDNNGELSTRLFGYIVKRGTKVYYMTEASGWVGVHKRLTCIIVEFDGVPHHLL